ncbi:hypothetical protein N657DRAFT_635970 [Parathielavia appendiculata]|uniref:RAD52 homolog n=1 Tax=Parathielavia appendiculata TaxID=2587402 RepID=A0AAN6TVB8_9PEZI|nr:hypothetical protein N657DRAFT_635970 [Parathielavia appendiculata]
MPAPGDQHTSIANPFGEQQQRISEYTAQEIATLQSRLEKQLGPEYISSRPGPSGSGGKVHYITAEKVIALANEVFGFNGWSSSIQNIQIDFVDEDPRTLRINLGLSVIVRVTLRDGTYHEDLGYGHIENAKGKAAAFEKAKKEGTTDALKRALRHFGNVLGNCIYDKTYLAKVTRMKVAPTKFDENCLHRHPDYVVKTEHEPSKEDKAVPPARVPPPELPMADSFEDFLGELDEADFNISDEGHPDMVVLTNSDETESNPSNASNRSHNPTGNGGNNPMKPPTRQLARSVSAGNNPPRQPPQTPIQQAPRPNTNNFPGAGLLQNRGPTVGPRPPQQQFNNQNRPAPHQPNPPNQNPKPNPQTHMTPPQTGNIDHNHANNNNNTSLPGHVANAAAATGSDTVGFFSARAVKALPEEAIASGKLAPKPGQGQAFNPHLASPSIPRTPGVDHSASKPVARAVVQGGAAAGGDGGGNNGDGGGTGGQVGGGGGGVKPSARPLGNVVNPQLDQARRIGAPGSSSPLGNRGQFRPLTVKRPAGGDGTTTGGNGGVAAGAPGRVPLGDVSNHLVVVGAGDKGGGSGPEAKRQRVS